VHADLSPCIPAWPHACPCLPNPCGCTRRGQQEEIINATLSGKDVFVLMPTGGGKVSTVTLSAPCNLTGGIGLYLIN